MTAWRRILARLGRAGEIAETTLLVLLMLAMVGLSAGQIVLRNFFDVGFIWTDELLRMMVLWLALAGGIAATRSDKHISINILDQFAGPGLRRVGKLVSHLFGAAVCAWVTVVAVDFVATTREYGDVLLGDFPAWVLQAVLPAGFALITWRYLVLIAGDVADLLGRKTPSGKESGA